MAYPDAVLTDQLGDIELRVKTLVRDAERSARRKLIREMLLSVRASKELGDADGRDPRSPGDYFILNDFTPDQWSKISIFLRSFE